MNKELKNLKGKKKGLVLFKILLSLHRSVEGDMDSGPFCRLQSMQDQAVTALHLCSGTCGPAPFGQCKDKPLA